MRRNKKSNRREEEISRTKKNKEEERRGRRRRRRWALGMSLRVSQIAWKMPGLPLWRSTGCFFELSCSLAGLWGTTRGPSRDAEAVIMMSVNPFSMLFWTPREKLKYLVRAIERLPRGTQEQAESTKTNSWEVYQVSFSPFTIHRESAWKSLIFSAWMVSLGGQNWFEALVWELPVASWGHLDVPEVYVFWRGDRLRYSTSPQNTSSTSPS